MKSTFKISFALLAGCAIGGAATQILHAQAKPPAYVITEVTVIDEAAFKEFAPKVAALNKTAGGKYVIRGGKVVALEGEPPTRFTLQVYENMEAAQASRNSQEWKDLSALRNKAVKTRTFIVEGVAN